MKSLTVKSSQCNVPLTQIKEIKDRIKEIKDEMCEGVKIRMKVEDRINGERISLHLLSKEKVKAKKKIMQELNTGNGVILDNTKAIVNYVKSFYENLFSKANVDSIVQDYFLQYVDKTVSDADNEMLCEDVSEKEIGDTFKSYE